MHKAWQRHYDEVGRKNVPPACAVVRRVSVAGGSDRKHMRDSAAVLANRDPVFALAIQRRGTPARTQALASVARDKYLALRIARYQNLALQLTRLARLVLAVAVGIVACLIAVTTVLLGKSVKEMPPLPPGDPPQVVCENWEKFLSAARAYFGWEIPCPPNSVVSLFANDPDRSPQLAWSMMQNLARQATVDVASCGDLYAEMGVPMSLPRKIVISLLKRYSAQFRPESDTGVTLPTLRRRKSRNIVSDLTR